MRKIVAILFCLCMAAGIPLHAAITGSPHDFSQEAWNDGEICKPCHTPHNADTSVAGTPLWNHEVTVQVFTLYSSPTLDATDLSQPDGTSKLCLSCHDGTVALDSFGGATGATFITGDALLGTDLSGSHPISFTYDGAHADVVSGDLEDPTSAVSGLGGTIQEDLLFGDKVECSSCHDVHDGQNQGATGHLLVKSNAASDLCLTCHIK